MKQSLQIKKWESLNVFISVDLQITTLRNVTSADKAAVNLDCGQSPSKQNYREWNQFLSNSTAFSRLPIDGDEQNLEKRNYMRKLPSAAVKGKSKSFLTKLPLFLTL